MGRLRRSPEMPELIDVVAPDIGLQSSWWRISKWVVSDGEYVTPCQTIAELENDEMTCELEAFDAGVFRQTAQSGEKVDAGAKIGELVFDQEEFEARLEKSFPFTVSLSGRELKQLDSYRGCQSRAEVIRRLVTGSLNQIGEQGGAGNPLPAE